MAKYVPKYNNFECWFPNGHYRLKGRNPSLIEHLDRVLKELHFNHYYFQRIMGRKHSVFRETSGLASIVKEGKDLSHEQQKRLEELDIELNTIYMDLVVLLEPVYYKIRELGFTHEELTR